MIRRHMDHARNRYPIVEDRVERPYMREVDASGPMNDADTSVVRMPTPVPVLVFEDLLVRERQSKDWTCKCIYSYVRERQ